MPVFHLTLAYLKKGHAAGYVGDTRFKGRGLTFPSITFSPHTGDRIEMPLKMVDGSDVKTDQFGQVPSQPPTTPQSDAAQVYSEDEAMATPSRQIKLSKGWQTRLAALQTEAGKEGNDPLVNGVNITLSDGRTISNVKVFDGQTLELDKELSMSGVVITDMTPGAALQADSQVNESPRKSLVYPTTSPEQQARDAANEAQRNAAKNAAYTDAKVAKADPEDGDGDAMADDDGGDESDAAKKGDKKPYGDVQYADPGYQKDGKKRYPIDTPEHIRAAWSYINKSSNCSEYSSEQCSHIKSKIVSAWKKHIDPKGPEGAKAALDMALSDLGTILARYGINTAVAGVSSSNPPTLPMNLSELKQSLAAVKTVEDLPTAVANVALFADAIAKASEQMASERKTAQDAATAAQASVDQIKADLAALTKTHNEMVAAQQAIAAEAKFNDHMSAVEATFDLDDEVRAEIVSEVKACETDESFAKWIASAKKKMKGFIKKKKADNDEDKKDGGKDEDTEAKAALAAKTALASAAAAIVDAPVNHDFEAAKSLQETYQATFAKNISIGGVKVSDLTNKAKK